MSDNVLFMIDEMVLEDLLLTRRINRARKSGHIHCPRHTTTLKELKQNHYNKLAKIQSLGGDKAVSLLVDCLREKKTTRDFLKCT